MTPIQIHQQITNGMLVGQTIAATDGQSGDISTAGLIIMALTFVAFMAFFAWVDRQ